MLQLVASLILFVCTIISTGRLGTIPVVKSSALATLFALRRHDNDTEYQDISTGDDGTRRDGLPSNPKEARRAARQMVARVEGGVMILSGKGNRTTTNSRAGISKIVSEPGDATHLRGSKEVPGMKEKVEEKPGVYCTTN